MDGDRDSCSHLVLSVCHFMHHLDLFRSERCSVECLGCCENPITHYIMASPQPTLDAYSALRAVHTNVGSDCAIHWTVRISLHGVLRSLRVWNMGHFWNT